MSDDLKLSLGPGKPEKRGGGVTIVFLAAIAALVAANLVLSISDRPSFLGAGPGLSAGKLEELALKLESQQLHGAAARAWTDYLGAAGLNPGERAAVWYRTGRLYQDGGDFERALDAYYRSEAIARVADIAPDISLRVTECLERLGRFAALRGELESRTAIDPGAASGGGEILAEIGGWKIDRDALRKMIEAEIDAQLSSVAGALPPGELAAQKERLLDEVLRNGKEEEWLRLFVAEELLYRMAMEDKVYDLPGYRDLAKNLERKLLLQKTLEKEYSSKISITEESVRAFYDANKDRFGENGAVKDFSEVSGQVYAALRAQKESEVQSALIEELGNRYDVVIRGSGGSPAGKGE